MLEVCPGISMLADSSMLEVRPGMFVYKSEHGGLPGLVGALEVGEEGEPEEAAEAHVDRPEPAGHELEVDGGEERPDTDTGLGGGRIDS